jgi:hypothetical protein
MLKNPGAIQEKLALKRHARDGREKTRIVENWAGGWAFKGRFFMKVAMGQEKKWPEAGSRLSKPGSKS